MTHAKRGRSLRRDHRSHGRPLGELPLGERVLDLPSYAQTQEERFPDRTVEFFRKDRRPYSRHKAWISRLLTEILWFPPPDTPTAGPPAEELADPGL